MKLMSRLNLETSNFALTNCARRIHPPEPNFQSDSRQINKHSSHHQNAIDGLPKNAVDFTTKIKNPTEQNVKNNQQDQKSSIIYFLSFTNILCDQQIPFLMHSLYFDDVESL